MQKQNQVMNSSKPLFGPDGEDNQDFEIGAIPKRTTGSISKPMQPK